MKDKHGYEQHRFEIFDSVDIVHITKDGKLSEQSGEDLITNAGMAGVAAIILTDVGGTAFDYVAIGSGTNAPLVADTTLTTELARKAATGSRSTTSVANDTAQWVVTFTDADTGCDGTQSVCEIGILNASSNGTLLLHQTFTPENMIWSNGDTLNCTIKVQIKQGA